MLKGDVIVPEDQLWISMVVPKPDEQTSSTEEPKGVTGSKADVVSSAPEPRLKRSPIGRPVDDGLSEWEVGDIVVLLPEERVRVTDGGVCMLTSVHMVPQGRGKVE